MTSLDVPIAAITCWRENRSGGRTGMQSVLNVIWNRAQKANTSAYEQCVKRLQFSSMTNLGDSQTILWPADGDPQMATALEMAQQMVSGQLPDITGGATFYYAASLTPAPVWAAGMTPTGEIANQLFFKESA